MQFFLLLSAVILVANAAPFSDETDQTLDVDFDVFGITKLLGGNEKASNDDKLKCLYNKFEKILDENTDLDWWFDDFQKTSLNAIENVEKCSALTGIAKTRCFLRFQTAFVGDVRRLQKSLPEDKKNIPSDAKNVIKDCLSLE